MALTSVGAIYATGTKLLQRIYIPHGDDSEIAQQHVAAGETLQSVPIATYQQGGPPAVQAAVGTPTFSGRCAVVNNLNAVIDTIIADPAIYTDPRGQVIASDFAALNDTWTGTIFQRPWAEIDFTTGLYAHISVQDVSKPTVQTTGNYLVSNPPNAVIGQASTLRSSLIGVPSALVAGVPTGL